MIKIKKMHGIARAVLCCLMMSMFLAACGNQQGGDINTMTLPDTVVVSYDLPVAADLKQMRQAAEFIVIGKYTEFDSKWNMARNPNNIQEEDPDNYTEGRLYRFSVDQVITGELQAEQILVNLRYSNLVNVKESNAIVDEQGRIVKEATKVNNVPLTVHDPLFMEPELGATYILFLSKDHNFGHYYGAGEPFAIKIDNNIASLQSNLFLDKAHFVEHVNVDAVRTVAVHTQISHSGVEDTISGMTLDEIRKVIG